MAHPIVCQWISEEILLYMHTRKCKKTLTTESIIKLLHTNIGRKVAHPCIIKCTSFKVTRSTNAETGSASYLPNRNTYKLERIQIADRALSVAGSMA